MALFPADLASYFGATASAPRECGFIWLCGPLLGPLIQPSDAWPRGPPLGIQASAAAVILQTGSHLDVKPKWPAQQAFGHIDLVVIISPR